MQPADRDSAILRFFRDDIGGILITDGAGNILYEDEKTAFIRKKKTNWKAACPPPRSEQQGEKWDLLHSESGRSYMVITSTFTDGEGQKQIHHLVDTSLYMGLYRDINDYSRKLQTEKEHDGLTGLYNKGKFMEMKDSLFARQDAIAVFNLDVNNLKTMNDRHGHEAGDRLIRKAAESLKKIEARNIMPFRVGGDEFTVILSGRDLLKLNRAEDGIPCTIACGFAFGEKGYDLEEVLALADRRMYEDKKKIKEQNKAE